jgi:hypothetical protein
VLLPFGSTQLGAQSQTFLDLIYLGAPTLPLGMGEAEATENSSY